MWAIAGTPKPIVDWMHAEVTKLLAQPEMRELWAKQGAEPGSMSQADFAAFLRSEITSWGKVVAAAGAKIDL